MRIAFAVLLTTVGMFWSTAAFAATDEAAADQPYFDNGFATLVSQLGVELTGQPVTAEMPGDEPETVIQQTEHGLFYWQPGHMPVFTNGHDRFQLAPSGPPIHWQGEELSAPIQTVVIAQAVPQATINAVAGNSRVSCIESKESGGANVSNRTGSGAGGVMQYMPGTFAAHAREMGHPEWSLWNPNQARAVAAHDLALGRRSQWTVSGC